VIAIDWLLSMYQSLKGVQKIKGCRQSLEAKQHEKLFQLDDAMFLGWGCL